MEEVFIGLIELFPYTFAPLDWCRCDGTILNVSSNQALFSLLSYKFGGNGTTTFAVPNLIGTEPVPNTCYYISLAGIYPSRP
ncbi:MAG TPA: tail fiber protein [Lachnospiraceae bacterium]|nr:tail fiber protein [Lachnospiraceae bacterium]